MSGKIIDLSVPISDKTDGVTVTLQDRLPEYLGQECYAYDLAIKSHTGTYFETPAHIFRNGKTTSQWPLEKLILPGVCIRITKKERCISAADLEKVCPDFSADSALLVDTGSALDKYFSRDAAKWMVDKKVALMASNLPRYDTGFENPTGFFIDLFKADIPIIANITNLGKLPESGFILIVLPLKIEGICTVSCRAAAVIDKF